MGIQDLEIKSRFGVQGLGEACGLLLQRAGFARRTLFYTPGIVPQSQEPTT